MSASNKVVIFTLEQWIEHISGIAVTTPQNILIKVLKDFATHFVKHL
jgi:hypothetical protein